MKCPSRIEAMSGTSLERRTRCLQGHEVDQLHQTHHAEPHAQPQQTTRVGCGREANT